MNKVFFSNSICEADCLEVFTGPGVHIGTIKGNKLDGYRARSFARPRVVFFNSLDAAARYLLNCFVPPVKVMPVTKNQNTETQTKLF